MLHDFNSYKFRAVRGNKAEPWVALLEEAINSVLSYEEAEIIERYFLAKNTQYEFEIASDLNISDRTVRRRKASALNKLVTALADFEIT